MLSEKSDSHEKVEVRAPAGTLRGASRISKLHVVQFGEARAPTAWQADKITAVIKQRPSSCVLQAFVLPRHFSDEHWARISKIIYRTLPDLPTWCARLGWKHKSLTSFARHGSWRKFESNQSQHPGSGVWPGSLVELQFDWWSVHQKLWRPTSNRIWAMDSERWERERIAVHAASQTASREWYPEGRSGLCVQRLPRTATACRRLEGLQKFVDKSDVIALLSANGWADVLPQSKRIRREGASWIVRARRTGVVLSCYRYEVSVENSPEPCFVEIAPFKPMPKPLSVIHAKDKIQSFEASPQVRPAKGPGAPSADGVVIPVESEEMDLEGEQDKALKQFFDAHGLIKHEKPKDGCCLFHSVGFFMKLAKRSVHAHNVLRDVAADTLELSTDGFDAVWDGNLPHGEGAENWEAYIRQIWLAGDYGGELEILALSRTLDLTFYIVRPGQPTIQVGRGKAGLWLLLRNRHYEPLSTSSDKAAVACRRAHAKSVDKGHKWISVEAMRSAGIVSGKNMRGGGKSQASCASDSSSLPNSLGRGSSRSKGARSGVRSLSVSARSSLPPSLVEEHSCASVSVPPTLRGFVKRDIGVGSLCVSAESSRLQSVGDKQSCASGSVPPSTLRGSVKRTVGANSVEASAEPSQTLSLWKKQFCVSKSVSSITLRGAEECAIQVKSVGISAESSLSLPLRGKQSCVLKSVSPSALKRSVNGDVVVNSAVVSAELSHSVPLRGKQSSVSESESLFELKRSVKRGVSSGKLSSSVSRPIPKHSVKSHSSEVPVTLRPPSSDFAAGSVSSPSKLIPKAKTAKFARQLQRLNKDRLDEWTGLKPRAVPRGKPKPRSLLDREIGEWRSCIEREHRVAAGAGFSVDVQQYVKRARWHVDQRDMAARVLQVRSRYRWLCAPSFNEKKKIWECSNCENIVMSVARLLQPHGGSVCSAGNSKRDIDPRFRSSRSWSYAWIPDKTELVGQGTWTSTRRWSRKGRCHYSMGWMDLPSMWMGNWLWDSISSCGS